VDFCGRMDEVRAADAGRRVNAPPSAALKTAALHLDLQAPGNLNVLMRNRELLR
jgi:hypothetical protein